MNDFFKKALLVLLIFYLLSFAFFFLISILTFPSVSYLDIYFWRWVWDNSLHNFIDKIIPVHTTALLLLFSFTIYKVKISSIIIFFLLFTFFYTFLTEGIEPSILKRQHERAYSTELARKELENAEKALKEGRLEEASEYIFRYLHIDAENAEAKRIKEEIDKRMGKAPERDMQSITERFAKKEGYSAEDMTAIAKEYFENEDFLSAHYYATLALRLDETNQEAKRIASAAWKEIESFNESRKDERAKELFRRKKEGQTALLAGNPVKAYYIFNSLKDEYPEDPDIETFYALSLNKVREVAFFTEEITTLEPLPGYNNIIFASKEEKYSEVFLIEKMISSQRGTFFFNIEVIGIDEEGGLAYHIRAPYGKLLHNSISIRCIHTNDPSESITPVSLAGKGEEVVRYIFSMPLTPDQIKDFRQTTFDDYNSKSILELLDLGKTLTVHGFQGEPALLAAVLRIVAPFTFILFSVLSMAAGIRGRSRGGLPHPISFFFLPGFPVIIYFILILYNYLLRIISGFLLFLTGFGITLFILIILNALMLSLPLRVIFEEGRL